MKIASKFYIFYSPQQIKDAKEIIPEYIHIKTRPVWNDISEYSDYKYFELELFINTQEDINIIKQFIIKNYNERFEL